MRVSEICVKRIHVNQGLGAVMFKIVQNIYLLLIIFSPRVKTVQTHENWIVILRFYDSTILRFFCLQFYLKFVLYINLATYLKTVSRCNNVCLLTVFI